MIDDTLHPELLAVITAAVDERWGAGTMEGLADYEAEDVTQTDLAQRWGISQPAASRRITKAAESVRKMVRAAKHAEAVACAA